MKPIMIFLFLSFVSFAEVSCEHDSKNFRCVQFVRNYDADTITFNIKGMHPIIGEKIKVRLNGVDAPERKGKNKCEVEKARTGQKLVESLLQKAKRIDLKNIKRGKYFRIVADVEFDGQKLADILRKNGLAYKYNGGKKKKVDWCRSTRSLASEFSK